VRATARYLGDGGIVYQQACKLGCGGTVSKRLGSTYRSGRSRHWIKVKNPVPAAVRREDEEEWGSDGAGRLLGMVDVRPAACLLPWLLIAFAGRAGRYPPAAV
jgi:hypothetical protein